MRKMLISLSEPLATWALERAEKRGLSVSELIEGLLDAERRRLEHDGAALAATEIDVEDTERALAQAMARYQAARRAYQRATHAGAAAEQLSALGSAVERAHAELEQAQRRLACLGAGRAARRAAVHASGA